MKKIILLSVAILLGIGGVVIYRMVTKGAVKAEDVQALSVNVATMTNDFTTQENAARKKYIGQVLAFNAALSSSETNQDGKAVLIFENGENAPTIRATLRDKVELPAVGADVKLKGFCDAYMPGEEMAGMVLPGTLVLTNCILEK